MSECIVFVCTGNICRSPMAQYLLMNELGECTSHIVTSAGIATSRGIPASKNAVLAMAEINIDMSLHYSKPLTNDLVTTATMIIVMTRSHLNFIKMKYPDALDKTFLIRDFDDSSRGRDLDDPIGASLETYRIIRDQIRDSIPGIIEFIRK